MKTAVVFDLDGTLIDSLPDLHRAAAEMLTEAGRAPLDPGTIRSFIGNGTEVLVERVMGATGLPQAQHAQLLERFMAFYTSAPSALTRAYPGVRAALEALREAGIAMGVCTNKPEAPARTILDQLDLAQFFPVVIGGDSLPERKPDPAGLLAAFDALEAGDRWFVGDSEVDAETAERAGVPFLLFTEGYHRGPVAAMHHARRFEDFARLPGLIG